MLRRKSISCPLLLPNSLVRSQLRPLLCHRRIAIHQRGPRFHPAAAQCGRRRRLGFGFGGGGDVIEFCGALVCNYYLNHRATMAAVAIRTTHHIQKYFHSRPFTAPWILPLVSERACWTWLLISG